MQLAVTVCGLLEFQAKNSRNTAATTARHIAWECTKNPRRNHNTPPVSVRTYPSNYQWQRAIAVRASRAATPWHDWDRSTRRLPSGRRIAADVCVTRVERVHHGDRLPTRRRISQPHCTSYFHHNLQHHRTITSDTAPMTDNCINTKDTWVTVILWQDYYTKMHTDSVTYVNANSSFFLLLLYCADFIIYALYM